MATEPPTIQTKPWKVTLTCCGFADGVYEAATWEEANALRESYTSGPGVTPHEFSQTGSGHRRSGVITREDSTNADPPTLTITAVVCEACDNTGLLPNEAYRTDQSQPPLKHCPTCHGKGWVWPSLAQGRIMLKCHCASDKAIAALDALAAQQEAERGE